MASLFSIAVLCSSLCRAEATPGVAEPTPVVLCATTSDTSLSAGARADGTVTILDEVLERLADVGFSEPASPSDLDFSPDGRYLVAVSRLAEGVLWDLDDPRAPVVVGRFALPESQSDEEPVRPYGVTWGPDSARWAAVGPSGSVTLHSIERPEGIRLATPGVLSGRSGVTWHSGLRVLLLLESGGIAPYSWATGERIDRTVAEVRPSTDGRPTAFALSPDEAELYVADTEFAVRVHDIASGRLLREWRPENWFGLLDHDRIRRLAVSPDGSRLAYWTFEGSWIGVLDSQSLDETYRSRRESDHDDLVADLRWTHDPSRLVVFRDCCPWESDVLHLEPISTWRRCPDLRNPRFGDAAGVAVKDGRVESWDVPALPPVPSRNRRPDAPRVPFEKRFEAGEAYEGFIAAAVSMSGDLVAGGRGKGPITLFDPGLQEIAQLEPVPEDPCGALSFSPDGRRLAAATSRGAAFVWTLDADDETRASTGSALDGAESELRRGAEECVGISWSPDSSRFVVFWNSSERALYGADGELLARWPAGEDLDFGPYSAIWLVDRGALLMRDGTGVAAFDRDDGEPLLRDGVPIRFDVPEECSAFALSPDGSEIVLCFRPMKLRWFDFETGDAAAEYAYVDSFILDPVQTCMQVQYSQDGERLAFSSSGGGYFGVLRRSDLTLEYDSDFTGAHFEEACYMRWEEERGRILFWFACGADGVRTLFLEPEPTWQGTALGARPAFSARGDRHIALWDGALIHWWPPERPH